MLCISSETRLPTTHFSLQVFTNSRYFCRWSKKRKFRCGSTPLLAAAGLVGLGVMDGDIVVSGALGCDAEGVSGKRAGMWSCVRGITAGRPAAFRFDAMKP